MTKQDLFDLDLEKQVLGSCILHPDNVLRYPLTTEDFYSGANAAIWSALLFLQADGEPIDTVRLRGWLVDHGKLAQVGGDEYLLQLTDTIPQRDLPIERLQRFRRLRSLERALVGVHARVQSADLDGAITALGETHSAALVGVQKGRTASVIDLCEGLLDELTGVTPPGPRVHPGYSILAATLGQLPLGCTVAILASTNVGKSSYAIEMCARSAERGETVGYLSVEDQRDVVRSRYVGLFSGMSSRAILQNRVAREDVPRIVRGLAKLEELRPRLHASILQGGTDADVCAAMTELAGRGCKLVVVDYLQKIGSSRTYSSKAHEVSATATRITSHAQRLGITCVLVSQCTRDRTKLNECPSKHDMKESGDLENMVDAIIGLWREYEDDFAPMWARLLKVKWGGVGASWRLVRDPETGRLHEVEGSDREMPPDVRGQAKGGRS